MVGISDSRKQIAVFTLIICILFGIVLSITYSRQFVCETHYDKYRVINYRLKNQNVRLLVADTPAKWEYGLMNIKSKDEICGNDGMIFTFPVSFPHTFWNKNTLVDVNVYWVTKDKVIGQSKLPSVITNGLQTVVSPGLVNSVIEIIK